MRTIISGFLFCVLASSAQAGPIFYVGAGGAPFCNAPEPLQDLLRSIDTNDNSLQQKVIQGGSCIMLKEKTEVEVIDHVKIEGGNGVKIRFSTGGKDFILYAIDQGFIAKN